MKPPRPVSKTKLRKPVLQLAKLAAGCVTAASDSPQREVREVEVCLGVAKLLSPGLERAAWQWVASCLPAPWQTLVTMPIALPQEVHACAREVLAQTMDDIDPLALFYEHFLHALDAQRRTGRGVFYTPPQLARLIVRNVDIVLRSEFSLTDGLLDETTWQQASERGWVATLPAELTPQTPLVRIFDPALGAGVFLTELLLAARRSVSDVDAWNDVAPRLLARLGGIEILPAAALVAVVRIAATLSATGYRFASDVKVDVRIGDALAAPIRPPWTVIVGNPPFSGISGNKHSWVNALLRGRGPAGERRADYFEFAGAPLAERKHWLRDDYVQFLRIAHEQVEATGIGIVALVTSHGYLDNVTFRALREKLLQDFPRISLIDLHGNAKRQERAPDGGRDENVFGIETGVAIGLFRRPPGVAEPALERRDLWGLRTEKFAALQGCDVGTLSAAAHPRCDALGSFQVHARRNYPEYESAWPLDLAMPVNCTAPVTARDAFVVADTIEDLERRMRDFCDAGITDDEIRARYFTQTRSRLYPPGDTRGWKLAAARQRMQTLDWRALVRPVLYRPGDERAMLWADWLVDWPRNEVTAHLLAGENLALITRRQAPPNQPWAYVWITDKLTLDGVIRSDNRGSESIFPLWNYSHAGRRANFAPEFLTAFAKAFDIHATNEEAVFYYIYALLHSQQYRDRYQHALAEGFPRVLIPRHMVLFQRLAMVGKRLIENQLANAASSAVEYHGKLPTIVAPGFPRYAERRLFLNASDFITGISERAWRTRIGTYQVCQKLLKDRRGKELGAHEISRLTSALSQVRRTAVLQQAIDRWALRGVDFARDFVADAGSIDYKEAASTS